MKHLITVLFAFTIALTTSCAQNAEKTNDQFAVGAKIKFTKLEHDFGNVPYSGKAIHDFEFKNNGDTPLILNDVRPQCGCTSPFWPKNEIKPGETAKIKVEYRTTTKVGYFNKTVTVYTNGSEKPVVLRFKGTVLQKPAQPSPEASAK